jgi:hypothetical protein
MHAARNRYRTVRATIREWRHEERWQKAWEQFLALQPHDGSGGQLVAYVIGAQAPEPPPEAETLLRVWLERPARIREERDVVCGRGESSIDVRDGDRWSLICRPCSS